MGRRANIILISSAAAILLVCAVIVIGAIRGFIGSGTVAGEVAKLKARGEPVSISDIVPQKVPSSANAAIIYAKAFKLLPKGDADPELQQLDELISGKGQWTDAKGWKSARSELAKHSQTMRLAEAASARPECRFPVDWAASWEAGLPHLKHLRKLTTLAAASSLSEANAGQVQEALGAVELGIKMPESLRNEPTLISYEVRIACIKRALSPLDIVLSSGIVSESQARRLDRALAEIELVRSGANAFRGERVFGIDTCERFVNRVVDGRSRPPSGPKRSQDKAGILPASKGLIRSVFEHDGAFYIRTMSRQIEVLRLPYRMVVKDKALASIGERDIPRYAIVSAEMLPSLIRPLRSRDECIAIVRGSRILLALRLYRQRTGSYPASLRELSADSSWKPLSDPFSGCGFVYRKQGRGCILYSLGANLKDDGGLASNWGRLNGSRIPKGDITWKLDR